MKTVMLVDGRNFVYRSHFAHKELKTSTGEPTSVLFGSLNGLLSLTKRVPGVPIVFVWDGGGRTWRHKLLAPPIGELKDRVRVPETWLDKRVMGSLDYLKNVRPKEPGEKKPEGYKAHREMDAKGIESRRVAVEQIPELIKALNLIGIRNYQIKNLEGDDLIGLMTWKILSDKIFENVIIHSTDTDFYQLLKYDGVQVMAGGEGMPFIDAKQVLVEQGISVSDWVRYRALVGDKTDNIPQLWAGLGPVRCRALLKAGFDASVVDPDKIPERAWSMFMMMVRDAVDRREVWKMVRRNYTACRIVTKSDFPLFPEDVKEKVSELCGTLEKVDLIRQEWGEKEYREFGEWLVMKEMPYLRGRMDEFTSMML